MTQGAAAARRLTIMAVAVALGAAGLAGCGKDEAPPAPSSSSSSSPAPTSASPAPSPTPTAPTPPPKPAWTYDDAGALAAAQYAADLYDYVNLTGDLTDWDAFTGPDCSFCRNTHDDIAAIYGSGGRIEGITFTMSDPVIAGVDETFGIRTVQYDFASTPGRAVDASGGTATDYVGESGFLLFELAWAGDHWLLEGGEFRDESAAS